MNIDIGIKGKRILLLGSCGVLGRAHARLLVKQKARLILSDRPGSKVLEEAKTLDVPGLEIDVKNEAEVTAGVEKAADLYNGLDGAIYNAAITSELLIARGEAFPDFEDYPLDLWQQAIDVNLTGAFLFSRETGMVLKSEGGSLIFTSSVYGVVGPDHRIYDGQPFRSFPAYSASKAGIIGLTRWLATWWGKSGIRVNCISPGGVFNDHDKDFVESYSRMVPMGRMANREDITGILIYLLSDASSYCTGQNFIIDGGLTTW